MSSIFDFAWVSVVMLTLVLTVANGWFITRLETGFPLLYQAVGCPGFFFFLAGRWLGVNRYMRSLFNGTLAQELHDVPQLRRASLIIAVLTALLGISWMLGLLSLVIR